MNSIEVPSFRALGCRLTLRTLVLLSSPSLGATSTGPGSRDSLLVSSHSDLSTAKRLASGGACEEARSLLYFLNSLVRNKVCKNSEAPVLETNVGHVLHQRDNHQGRLGRLGFGCQYS